MLIGGESNVFELKLVAEFLNKPLVENLNIESVCIDSRLCEKNSLFFALEGEKVDGHDFLKEAAQKGAVAAIVSTSYQGKDFDMELFKVDNPLKTLQSFAHKIIRDRNPLIVGITGSVGKTTTKEFVYQVLDSNLKVSKTNKSYNGQIGLPLSILNANSDAEVLVLEYGMNQRGEMQNLLDIAEPHIAVITPIASAHLGYFESVEDIAEQKAVLLTSSHLQLIIAHELANSFSAVNAVTGIEKVTYGQQKADVTIARVGKEVQILDQEGERVSLEFPKISDHHLENFLPAYIIAKRLKLGLSDIQKRVEHLKTERHRFEIFIKKGITYVDDSYNANPYSVGKAIENLPKPSEGGKVIAVLGEMKELGISSEKEHQNLGKKALRHVDKLICFGKESKPTYLEFNKEKEAKLFDSHKEVFSCLQRMVKAGDIVLLKGANSNQLWKIAEEIKH